MITMDVIYQTVSFLSWALFTFTSHFCAKIFLAESGYLFEDVIILTIIQMFFGSLLAVSIRKEVKLYS